MLPIWRAILPLVLFIAAGSVLDRVLAVRQSRRLTEARDQ